MSFIGVSYHDRRIYIPKPPTWQEMLVKVSQSFSLNDDQARQLRVLYRPDICDESSPLFLGQSHRYMDRRRPARWHDERQEGRSRVLLSFWEGEAFSTETESTSLNKADRLDSFNPSQPYAFLQHCHEALAFEKFIGRLDTVLEELSLTPAMRTEFVVYWLPAFRRIRDRGQHIKFTFVPQETFAKAAVLKISGVSGPPKAFSRVFMLFSAVDPARNEPTMDTPMDWVRHVGQDREAMQDPDAFRVLEWGGMELRD
ncbi:uncharacterized protein PG986_009737 [Apiospora aurea]|uniref:Uncharacterized protein n=1 Tax=Apiospora aurea TaxID=335848 RepID=A0ABR1Q9T8_9PEZI